MTDLGFHGLSDISLALFVGVLFIAQFVLFTIVGCLVIMPLWLLAQCRSVKWPWVNTFANPIQ